MRDLVYLLTVHTFKTANGCEVFQQVNVYRVNLTIIFCYLFNIHLKLVLVFCSKLTNDWFELNDSENKACVQKHSGYLFLH